MYEKGDHIRFGFIGNLSPHKGTHVLINAFKSLNSKAASLLIFGTGEKAYQEKLVEMSRGANVMFMGAFQAIELGRVFKQIDVLVTPSICYENYPFVISEAFASLVPVIASNLGGMAERIQDNINGYLFKAGDPCDLATKLRQVINDPGMLNSMKEYIRLKVVLPSIEQEAYCYQQMYQRIIAERI